ncbi:MAG: antibiotic biosynthesis monooxygenase [Christensenellaceae bacterium]|nr:antibiotic biosynthesis monooxygenase [Christensenellaceae bacterium]PWM63095.1 MAG: antibiotic biosynthesis monooxygenase [Clostridia bacterium]
MCKNFCLLIHIYYSGKGGSARGFADEMTVSSTVEMICAEAGNLRYEYYFPTDNPETVLLIDEWQDQTALDLHNKSDMMQTIATLREKYKLKTRVERYLSEK